MTTTSFDASFDLPAGSPGAAVRAGVVLHGRLIPAVITGYKIPATAAAWALVTTAEPVDARWRDGFDVLSEEGQVLGHGSILLPSPPPNLRPARRRELLERLSREEAEMVLVLAELRGIHGLRAADVSDFSRLEPARVEELARGLEAEAKIRILSFSPLSFVLQESLDFLRRRVAAYLAQYQKKHPAQRSVPFEKIENRFDVAPNVLRLALRTLAKEGRVSLGSATAELVGYLAPLSAEDEKILGEMESLFLEGEFGQVSLGGLRRRFHMSPGRLQRLLTVLMERKKIVEGRDGFILHSRWLEGVIEKLRASGRRELTVADFKAMTGLTRKYAIPLLELLDEMGVTRRKGAVRDILR
jgi:selenocysteine-specific elongation factor